VDVTSTRIVVTRIVHFHFVRHLALDPIGERGEALNIPFSAALAIAKTTA